MGWEQDRESEVERGESAPTGSCEVPPACATPLGWLETFQWVVWEADRVDVHWLLDAQPGKESQAERYSETVKSAVEDLIARIEILEEDGEVPESPEGDSTLRFFQADRLVAEMVLRYGSWAQWNGWPAPAALTLSSREELAEWLSDRGIFIFARQHEEQLRRLAVLDRLRSRYRTVLPTECVHLAARDASSDEIVQSLRRAVPDPVDRAVTAFALLGCDDGPWDVPCEGVLERAARDVLRSTDPADRAEAAENARDDSTAREGLVRWLFHHEELWSSPDDPWCRVVHGAVRFALAHTYRVNRRRTMDVLQKLGGEYGRFWLRRVLQGDVAAREGVDPDLDFAGLADRTRRSVPDDIDDCSDRAYAAQLLSRRGDTESLEVIRSVIPFADGADRRVLLRASARLERMVAGDGDGSASRLRSALRSIYRANQRDPEPC